jgi:DNA helicase-2/ATP-dependent DNA helicase PcrA
LVSTRPPTEEKPTFTTNANDQQRSAILSTDGPLLIIAGPGTGKTKTLVDRITYLIVEKNVPPESLLVVSFTEKSARELKTRITDRLNSFDIRFNINEAFWGTIHGVCLRIIDEHRDFTRLKRNYIMLDEFDQQFLIYKSIREYRKIPDVHLILGNHSAWRQSEVLQKWVNKLTEEVVDPATLEQAPEPEVRALGTCYRLYRRQLEEDNGLDFSSFQLEALRLLQEHPRILQELRSKISHIMVDEYQDTNAVQEKILKLLTNDKGNLCVVGDDDQGLYRFRGATIRNILEFPTIFKDRECRQVTLTTNYRSHPGIIEYYNQWMWGQKWYQGDRRFRFPKTIEPRQDIFPCVPAVIKIAAPKTGNLHEEIHAFLNRLKESGKLNDWNQVAFLFRSVKHRSVAALSAFLERNGIPVYSPRSGMFFDREEVRLMIGALLFLFPQYQDVRKWADDANLDIWDYYDHSCRRLFAEELRKPENISLLKWATIQAERHRQLTENTDYVFSSLFYQLLQFPLFSRYLSEKATSGIDRGRAARNLATFSGLLGKFEYLHHVKVLNPHWLTKNLRDLFNQFLRYLKDGGIDEYEDAADYAPSGCVSFMTIHQSKGLEFPVVVVGSLGAVPQKSYTDLDEILENKYLSRPPYEPLELVKYFDFRRLYYTAFSRAQNLLVLACQEKTGHSKEPSRYFADLIEPLPHWHDQAFKPELMTFEKVKSINLKKEYSFTSHITVFQSCSEQYRFFKELEFMPVKVSPMLFGTLVHDTLEDIHTTALRGEAETITPAMITAWFNSNYDLLSRKERVYLAEPSRRAALNQVLRYYEREKGELHRLREAEVKISLVKDSYILRGSLDLVRSDGDSVEIIDFKADVKPDPSEDWESLERNRRQLEVYAHLVEERTGQRVSKMSLYYTGETGNPYITFTKDNRAIVETVAAFDSILFRIQKKDFRQGSRPTRLCSNCDLRLYCDRKK